MNRDHPRPARALCAFAAALLTTLLTMLVAAPPAAADAIRDQQWYLDALGVAEAQQITRGGGVTVAVVDSRAKITHPDLAGKVLPGKDFMPSGETIRNRGHGVAVASVLAGDGHGPGNQNGVLGIAPETRILPARAMNDPIYVAKGIRWAVDQGASVINVSQAVGYNGPDLEEAIRYAQAHDVVVVAGAGNAPRGDDEVQYPAAYPGVVAVSATDRSGQISYISTTGPKVDIAAPGEDIPTAEPGGGYSVSVGTSLATPIVAGTAALIRARYPDLNAASVINRLIKTATDKGPGGPDSKYGHGIVNPVQALTADVPPVQKNPLGSLAKQQPAATNSPGAAGGHDSNGGGLGAGLIIAIAAAILIVLAVVVAVIVRSTRRKPTPAKAGRHGAPNPPPYGAPHPGPGQPYGGPPRPGPPPGPPGAPPTPPGGPGPYGPPPGGWQPPPRR